MLSVLSSDWYKQISRNCAVRFPEEMLCQKDEEMCWATADPSRSSFPTAMWTANTPLSVGEGVDKDLWWDKIIKHWLGNDCSTLFIIYWGWTHSSFLKCEWYYVQLYPEWYRVLAPASVQDLCFTRAMGRVVSQVRPWMNWTKQSNWMKFLSQIKSYFQRIIPGPWLELGHCFGSITLLCLNTFPCSSSPEFQSPTDLGWEVS